MAYNDMNTYLHMLSMNFIFKYFCQNTLTLFLSDNYGKTQSDTQVTL